MSWGPNESRFRTEAICFLLLTIFITRAVFDLVQLDVFVLPVTQDKYGKDITNPVASTASNIDEILAELDATKIPERAGRALDHETEDAFERLRVAGYL